MSEPAASVVLIQASPHAGGVSDCLADAFAAPFPPHVVHRVALREHAIAPCRGCNACAAPPHTCVLDTPPDAAQGIFAVMRTARLLVVCAPIYFYGLPGQCKGFIDRGQQLWQARGTATQLHAPWGLEAGQNGPQALALLAAGRPRGEQLFAGALLTLKYFFALFDAPLADTRGFYGLDDIAALNAAPDVCADIRALGQRWAQTLCP